MINFCAFNSEPLWMFIYRLTCWVQCAPARVKVPREHVAFRRNDENAERFRICDGKKKKKEKIAK